MIFRRSVRDAATQPDEAATGDPQDLGDQTEVVSQPEAAAEETEVVSQPETAAEETEVVSQPEGASDPDPDATVVREPEEPEQPEPEETGRSEATEPHEELEQPDQLDDPDATAVRAAVPATPASPTEETAVVAAESAESAGSVEPAGPPKRRRGRGRKVLLGVGIALVLLAGGYVAAAWYFGDKVPQDTTVAGVDISGLTADEAVATLNAQLAGVVADPIPVQAGERTGTIDPAAAGLTFDAAATVDQVTGFTLDPEVVLGHLLGLGPIAPVVEVDEAALEDAVTAGANDLDVPPVDAMIELADGESSLATEPVDGLAVDVDASTDLIAAEWLTGQRPFTLPSEPVPPTLGDEAVETAMTEIVDPLLSGPVTVQLNDAETDLSPEQLTNAAALVAEGARFQLVIDGEALATVITDAVPSIGETPQDAQIVLKDGEPTIVPAVTGTGLDPEQLAGVVADAAVATDLGERVAVAELADTEPEFSTEDAEALGVVEVVGEFSTPYPYDPTRTLNLVNGAAHINGTLILPGELFSLIEALGPITAANGYVSSGVVENGFVTDAMGGGLSQISTTTFNAAFEAGMEDVFHKPHSRWFTRYPAGREATMFAPSLDMQWRNNTPYGVLVQAWVSSSESRVHVRMWSTDYWDVDIVSGEKYAFTSPRTVYNESPTCQPESGGASGFSINVSRTVSLDGESSEYSRDYTWTYSPWNRVVCGSPPSADSDKDDDEESPSTD